MTHVQQAGSQVATMLIGALLLLCGCALPPRQSEVPPPSPQKATVYLFNTTPPGVSAWLDGKRAGTIWGSCYAWFQGPARSYRVAVGNTYTDHIEASLDLAISAGEIVYLKAAYAPAPKKSAFVGLIGNDVLGAPPPVVLLRISEDEAQSLLKKYRPRVSVFNVE
ncbi:MAG: hypothetical protein NTV51_06680 [Verrucomicrobia bacterium]|nr:hypothetical protein [Verrucomicrobiota bacterium]